MKKLTALAIVASLAGCASVQNAGTASYAVRPIVIDGKQICCEVSVTNGKEIALLDATVSKRADEYYVHLHEEGVAAFKGQQIAAQAGSDLASNGVKAVALGAAAAAAPLLAPALVAPGLGAAVVGAGATLGVQKLTAPTTPAQ